jgi:hypothetical protein
MMDIVCIGAGEEAPVMETGDGVNAPPPPHAASVAAVETTAKNRRADSIFISPVVGAALSAD